VCVHAWINGWTDAWVHAWMEERIGGQVNAPLPPFHADGAQSPVGPKTHTDKLWPLQAII